MKNPLYIPTLPGMKPMALNRQMVTVIPQCRSMAREIADRVHREAIDRYTTVTIERTVLRAYGIDGVNPDGYPLVNSVVDRIAQAGLLGYGAAFFLGRAMIKFGEGPSEAANRIAYGGLAAPDGADPDGLFVDPKPGERERIAEILVPHTHAALDRIDTARGRREELLTRLPGQAYPGTPLKYLIVATGNIYDDATQAVAAAEAGADIIAVIRASAQSLFDHVPYGATTEGTGGTWATQENFRIVRRALDEAQERLGRYIRLVNYSSGLCMPEIAYTAAVEGLDMLLNDAMYGILFRDINPRRTLCDQYFSRRIIARAGITINTGEDNYLTTADAVGAAHTVLASQLINEAFALRAGLPTQLMGLGHAFEIDKSLKDGFVMELAQAQMVRQIFPDHPIKWMPATKHKTGNIVWSALVDGLCNLVGVMTGQSIELLGICTESVHTPWHQDRVWAIRNADHVYRTARHLGDQFQWDYEGLAVRRAQHVVSEAYGLLERVQRDGLFSAIACGVFADVKRAEEGGKGFAGVVQRRAGYLNPILERLEAS